MTMGYINIYVHIHIRWIHICMIFKVVLPIKHVQLVGKQTYMRHNTTGGDSNRKVCTYMSA